MAERLTSQLWMRQTMYVVLALAVLFWQLLPLSSLPASWAGPEWLIALSLAWAQRRPEFVPLTLIAAVILLADFLLQRPPGLMAALVVIGAEQLKTRAAGLRDASFAGEWVAAGLVVIGILVMNRVVLTVLVVDQAPIGLALSQMILTVLAYPVVVLVSHLFFGVRKLTPGDDDAIGTRT